MYTDGLFSYNNQMISGILIFIIGISVGSILAHSYFNREIKKHSDNNLTIEAIIHELRTPLTGLNWIFSLLSDIKINDNIGQETLGLIKEGVNKVGNALGLANDALVALNTNIGQASYKFEKNNIRDVIDKVIEENSLGAKEKSINIELEFKSDLVDFSFDLIKITLTVRNLINNAIKYTPKGGKISIQVHRDGSEMVIVVSDTGIGIPAPEINKVSNKFFRAKNIGDITGSGLGLFIVRNIVAGHQGRIDIQSKEGEGTKVTIFLPIK